MTSHREALINAIDAHPALCQQALKNLLNSSNRALSASIEEELRNFPEFAALLNRGKKGVGGKVRGLLSKFEKPSNALPAQPSTTRFPSTVGGFNRGSSFLGQKRDTIPGTFLPRNTSSTTTGGKSPTPRPVFEIQQQILSVESSDSSSDKKQQEEEEGKGHDKQTVEVEVEKTTKSAFELEPEAEESSVAAGADTTVEVQSDSISAAIVVEESSTIHEPSPKKQKMDEIESSIESTPANIIEEDKAPYQKEAAVTPVHSPAQITPLAQVTPVKVTAAAPTSPLWKKGLSTESFDGTIKVLTREGQKTTRLSMESFDGTIQVLTRDGLSSTTAATPKSPLRSPSFPSARTSPTPSKRAAPAVVNHPDEMKRAFQSMAKGDEAGLFDAISTVPQAEWSSWVNKGGFTLLELGESRKRPFLVHKLKVELGLEQPPKEIEYAEIKEGMAVWRSTAKSVLPDQGNVKSIRTNPETGEKEYLFVSWVIDRDDVWVPRGHLSLMARQINQ